MSIASALTTALADRVLALADDELILAHRNSEWTGHAPILEEDIALANIAQDELGHATLWFGVREKLTGDKPDRLAFFRDASDFRNVQLVALPRGDWALTMLRQFLFDAYEQALLPALAKSGYPALAAAARKMIPEEMYHWRHTTTWARRLGLGTAESNGRLQAALKTLWPYTAQLWVPMTGDESLAAAGLWPEMAPLHEKWTAVVEPFLDEVELTLPESAPVTVDRSVRGEHLAPLLAEMQSVARSDPEAAW